VSVYFVYIYICICSLFCAELTPTHVLFVVRLCVCNFLGGEGYFVRVCVCVCVCAVRIFVCMLVYGV